MTWTSGVVHCQDDALRTQFQGLSGVGTKFKAAPYLRMAVSLQEMGREDACKVLARLAQDDSDRKVTLLCRMLFTKRQNTNFRAPRLGRANCIGESDADSWPLVPVEIVNGVPFLIAESYDLSGTPETSSHYLKYCVENCDWSSAKFEAVDARKLNASLEKLLEKATKLKEPLNEYERKFLSNQIK